MESVASKIDWPVGGPLHVWTMQLACMAANAVFVAAIAAVGVQLWRRLRGGTRVV